MKRRFQKPMLLLLCASLALSVALTGCGAATPKNFPVAVSDTTRSALELNKSSFRDADLDEIYRFVREGATVSQLNDKYEISCLRQTDSGYSVLYWGTRKILRLDFDAEGNWIAADRLHSLFRLIGSRVKLDNLKEGDPVLKVQQADPTAYFPFLADKTSADLETNHYSEDGYHTRILYDADFNVKSVTYELM
ncbi:hypothetical protein [Ruminococcus sp.]|uniref:hypothetical protein n=1 Tax=Ruminococcus sp. TaxID=41978 RepID=UPI0038901873